MNRFFWKVMLLPLTFLQIWELVSGYFLRFQNCISSLLSDFVVFMKVKPHHTGHKIYFPIIFLFGTMYLKGWKGLELNLTNVNINWEKMIFFVVDAMYKKRYRYYIHNCYYTMPIFYPVLVDVIFIECFDPGWRGWSVSVLSYLQPCSRNNRPAV